MPTQEQIDRLGNDIAIAKKDAIEMGIQCRCDFDRWEPAKFPRTGHTGVCPIHKEIVRRLYG